MEEVAALPHRPSGEVVEWLMGLVLKTSEVKASAGSNPALSVQMASAEPSPAGACPAGLASVQKVADGEHCCGGLRAGAVELPFKIDYALLP